MQKTESILKNEIKVDHLILTRRPDQVIVYKKERTCRIVNFAVPINQRVKMKK